MTMIEHDRASLIRATLFALATSLVALPDIALAIKASGSCPIDLSSEMHMGDMSGSAHAMSAMSMPKKTLELIESECINCHGTRGISHSHDVPHLAGQNALYLCEWLSACHKEGTQCESHEDLATDWTDEDLIALARHYSMMPSFSQTP